MVSIIVTAYNVAPYIKKCINSCINQSCDDIEIIVVNDGSKDDTESIIKACCEKDSRIKYLYQENSGVSVARNNGVDAASGEFIMFVDGDDCLSEDIIAQLMSAMTDNTDIIACCCTAFDNDKEYINRFFDNSYTMSYEEDKIRLYLQLLRTEAEQPAEQQIFTGVGVPWGKLYRKSFLDNHNLRFDPSLRRMQDNVFNMYAFEKAAEIIYLDAPLYYYRIDNIITYKNHYPAEIYYRILEEREKFFADSKLSVYESIQNARYFEKMDNLICSIKNICTTNPYGKAVSLMKEYSGKSIYRQFLCTKKAEDPMKLKLMRFLLNTKMYAAIYLTYKVKP